MMDFWIKFHTAIIFPNEFGQSVKEKPVRYGAGFFD